MPTALPLTTSISQGSSRKRVNRILSAQFGDGYSQEAPDGLNANYDIWSIQYIPLSNTDRSTLWAALDLVGAVDYLTWQPPGATESRRWKVVKDSISESPISGDLWDISFQLRQVF